MKKVDGITGRPLAHTYITVGVAGYIGGWRLKVTDKEIIDKLLHDKGFTNIVEADIGKVLKVQVDWPQNQIRFYEEKSGKSIPIDATLSELKGQVN